jgi:LPPG:FO 2-phospho-L-lactate transferase
MSDDPVRTVISTDVGELPMQQYFVQRRSEPRVKAIHYQGVESARPSPQFLSALSKADQVVFCPSNPFLSIGPILALPGVKEWLSRSGPDRLRVAVSPIVGGAAVRGPADKIMSELGHEVSCVGVARQYQGLCDVFFIDEQDSHLAPEVEKLGMKPAVTSIIMNTEADKIALAQQILELIDN